MTRASHPKNNWELSVLRATSVVEIMTGNTAISPTILMAAGRGEFHPVEELDKAKNRSWRPFQLAFLLLSIPSLADPTHTDRVQPIELKGIDQQMHSIGERADIFCQVGRGISWHVSLLPRLSAVRIHQSSDT